MNSNHPFADIYARIPKMKCAGKCGDRHDGCCGPIGCTAVEAQWLDQFDGIQSPWVAGIGGNLIMDPDALDLTGGLTCPHLSLDGRCGAYDVRPLICRIWGTTRVLACPCGCQPERWLSRQDVYEIFQAVEQRQKELEVKA